MVEYFCANESEAKFMCVLLKSCQNTSEEGDQSIHFKKNEITETAFMFPLLKWYWFPWEENLQGFQGVQTETWLLIGWHKKCLTLMKCRLIYRAQVQFCVEPVSDWI